MRKKTGWIQVVRVNYVRSAEALAICLKGCDSRANPSDVIRFRRWREKIKRFRANYGNLSHLIVCYERFRVHHFSFEKSCQLWNGATIESVPRGPARQTIKS